MDIKTLKRKKRKSVQVQNAISKQEILECAKCWLEGEKLPNPIEEYFSKKGINRQNYLLVEYFGGPAQLQMSYSGILLSNKGVFIEFEFDLDIQETKIESVEKFGQIEIEISAHLKGKGKSFGFLSKEILHELRN